MMLVMFVQVIMGNGIMDVFVLMLFKKQTLRLAQQVED